MTLVRGRALAAAMLLLLPAAACSKDDQKPVTATASVSADQAAQVRTPDGALAVTIPKGAVDGEGTLQVAPGDPTAGKAGWQITLTGAKLVGDAVLRFKWAPAQLGEPLPLITYSDSQASSGAPTVVRDASAAGGFVEVRTNHFSFWQIRDWGSVLDQVRTTVFDKLDSVLSAAGSGREPKCENEDAVRKAGYKVTSDGGRRVYWCLGKEDDTVVLKVVNARGYGVDVEAAPGVVLTSSNLEDLQASVAKLIPVAPMMGGNTVSLLPSGEQADYRLDGKGQHQTGVNVQPSTRAYLVSALLLGVDSYLLVAGAAGVTVPEKKMVTALKGLSCMDSLTAMATTEPDSAPAAVDFFTKALQMSFGCAEAAGESLGALGVVGGGVSWVMSALSVAANTRTMAVDAVLDWTGYEVRITKPKPKPVLTCGAKDLGLNLREVTGPAADKARKLYRAVVACDKDALVRIATQDGTELSLGMTTPSKAFAIPNPEDRYSMLSRLLSVRPTVDTDGTVYWPWADPDTGLPDVAELQKAGLLPAGSDGGVKELGMYIGWRLSITKNGKLGWFAAGE